MILQSWILLQKEGEALENLKKSTVSSPLDSWDSILLCCNHLAVKYPQTEEGCFQRREALKKTENPENQNHAPLLLDGRIWQNPTYLPTLKVSIHQCIYFKNIIIRCNKNN